MQTCTAKTEISRFSAFMRSSCQRFQDIEVSISHESCDETNCNALKRQLGLMMNGVVADNCHQFIEVDDSCNMSEKCSTHAGRRFLHPRQSVVAYISIAANDKRIPICCGTHGPDMVVVGEANDPVDFDNGCSAARVSATEKLKDLLKYIKGEKGVQRCSQFIVSKDCVVYDKHVQP